MITAIKLVEADGTHYIDVSMDGETKRRGPFPDADAASAAAAQFAAIFRRFKWPVTQAAPTPAGRQQRVRFHP
jgi:hypothetical protein